VAIHIADQRQELGLLLVVGAPLFHEGQRAVEAVGVVAGALGEAEIGGADGHIGDAPLQQVIAEQVEGGEHIAGDFEEALDLAGMQIDGDVAVCAGGFDQVSDQAGGNRDARLVLFVGAGVGQVGDDHGDAPRRVALEGVDHDEHFHDVVADRCAHRLHQVNVLAADAFLQLDEDVLVGEHGAGVAARLQAQVVANLAAQLLAGRSAEQLDLAIEVALVAWLVLAVELGSGDFMRPADHQILCSSIIGGKASPAIE